MSNKVMSRSVHQAIYKYLPGSWGDFYDRDSRVSYTMEVKYWNSDNLGSINKKRIISEVKNEVKQFQYRGGKALGFGSLIATEYSVLTPKCSENPEIPDIISHVSPLTFYCIKCNSVAVFNNSGDYFRCKSNRYCKKNNCGGELKQISLVYACKCGWASPIYPNECSTSGHGIKYLKYRSGNFNFSCSKDGRKIEMIKYCPECNKPIFPRNTSSGDIFIPFNFSLIELLNSKEEDFLIERDEAAYIVMSRWLNQINNDEYDKFVKNSDEDADGNQEDLYNTYLQQLIGGGLQELQAKTLANNMANENDPNTKRNALIDEIKPFIIGSHLKDEYNIKKLATSLVEYHTILNSNVKVTIDEGINNALTQNSIFSEKEYLNVLEKYGFSKVQACGDIPIINCVYGYTRRESDPSLVNGEMLTLRSLKEESPETKNVYAVRLLTEGILFELDRGKVIEHLIKNDVLDPNIAPNTDDDEELKLWFLNNINLGAINTFSRIDEDSYKYTSHVYNLIHSISHALIKVSEEFSGLDKNSLAEYLFPSIPSFFIYCQNNQGTSLGSLFSLYNSVLPKWIVKAGESLNKCIFDPMCIDGESRDLHGKEDIACLGCLYINEISCRHFNKDLNRRYLTGYTDLENNKIYGYWEE